MKDNDKNIIVKALEDVVGDGFGRYSKYIIQDRAIPDARDGLKPVQRRILYAMHKEGNVSTKAYRKSAKSVGVIIGNYHPHGDSSVYDAMVRLSQSWKLNYTLVDMHGNNGSVDGDSAAAMRYTEARLSQVSALLLQDVEKNTVPFAPNFDDTELEPVVLPAYFPNLLVNGSTGISAGYATDIPPHNLAESIDAVIYRMKKPKCPLDDLLEIVKGPDFPTGATIQGKEQIKKAYETGKGRVVVRSKVEVKPVKNIKVITISQLPYEVNKAELVKKIEEIKYDKIIDGIIAVRDESDRNGLSVVIELKKDANETTILNYLYKTTNLQVYYNFNMVAIVNKTPKLLGLIGMLDAYIEHQREVLTNYSLYELDTANARMHIVEGLMKAVDVIDKIIVIIRASKNRSESITNLITEFAFTEKQASAIVDLRLYRLSNTDVIVLQEEQLKLQTYIEYLTDILDNAKSLDKVIIDRMKKIKKDFAEPRKTMIIDEIEDINITKEQLIQETEVMISVSKDGYIKRSSLRSYSSSNDAIIRKEDDFVIAITKATTLNKLLVFFDNGYYAYIPVYEIMETKWKDFGRHINNYVSGLTDAKVLTAMIVDSFKSDATIVSVTENGQVKQSKFSDFEVSRYTKAIKYNNLKKEDKVVSVFSASMLDDIIMMSKKGYTLRYPLNSVSITGLKSAGVKGIKLDNDQLVSAVGTESFSQNQLFMIFENGSTKRIRVEEIAISTRANKGTLSVKNKKTNPDLLTKLFSINDNEQIFVCDSGFNVEMIEAFDTKLSHGHEGIKKSIKLKDGLIIIEACIIHDLLHIPLIVEQTKQFLEDSKYEEFTPEQLSIFEENE
ncbi:DNA topoisomerase IV subunit A [Mycoplasma sp. P36-A1]|uniref:DNA topoisomerase IV subunit A n=1 Tax=Mycoplasma sp. P36-A1 TaxID=3252900 RepID=UPI003C30084D